MSGIRHPAPRVPVTASPRASGSPPRMCWLLHEAHHDGRRSPRTGRRVLRHARSSRPAARPPAGQADRNRRLAGHDERRVRDVFDCHSSGAAHPSGLARHFPGPRPGVAARQIPRRHHPDPGRIQRSYRPRPSLAPDSDTPAHPLPKRESRDHHGAHSYTATSDTVPVNLAQALRQPGITTADNLSAGEFNIWYNSFPADELPAPGSEVVLGGIRFKFPMPNSLHKDNFRCARQLVSLPRGRYDWIYLLAASERRSEDPAYLHYADGSVDPEWLRVSDFWAETPAQFGETESLQCTKLHYPRHIQHRMGPVIWRTRISVPRESELVGLRLPDNSAIHIFAISLAATSAGGVA